MLRTTAALGALTLATTVALAAEPAPAPGGADADALDLADNTKEVAAKPQRSWRVFGEAGVSRSWEPGHESGTEGGRLSLDLRYDGTLAPGLRAVFSDRLDLGRSSVPPRKTNINTLREAYLSWQVRPDVVADLGRVNLRYGAALGYNPTDFFRFGAQRSIVTRDPVSLRENRQGTFVLQGQKLWSDGSLSAVYSPYLSDKPNDSTFAIDAGSTNFRNRWLLAGSYKLGSQFSPQVLLHGGDDQPVQVGLNLSSVVNSSTVAFFEYAAGRSRSLIDEVQDDRAHKHLQQRAAAGLTYTTSFNLSLTAEAEYNSAAPRRGQWRAYRGAGPFNALALLGTSQRDQELPVRRALFVYANWRDLGMRNFDVSGFVRQEWETHSREMWTEARYHWGSNEVALQYLHYGGNSRSVFGSVPEGRRVELLYRRFL
ncbi:hypothetical protein [Piscinibacter koreensis]|uniref:Porin n=1 Tax=Piscinibacter koreensis TaxID=2742824 RepID=A0A7Y6NS29_9BURK|nr:hypothetical protein [Schlegelella koreensis]NUZ08322.1 hypothetical protein [Schlegelella koreensis]